MRYLSRKLLYKHFLFQTFKILTLNSKKSAKLLFMRIDKFLNVVNITKRRAIAEDMCKSGIVSINGIVVKPSKDVKVADIISLKFNDRIDTYKVLALPVLKNIPKTMQSEFVQKL